MIARKEKGLSQKDLADRVGIKNNTISRIETGLLIPKADLLLKISKELGQTMEYLMGEEN